MKPICPNADTCAEDGVCALIEKWDEKERKAEDNKHTVKLSGKSVYAKDEHWHHKSKELYIHWMERADERYTPERYIEMIEKNTFTISPAYSDAMKELCSKYLITRERLVEILLSIPYAALKEQSDINIEEIEWKAFNHYIGRQAKHGKNSS